ncbi:MAG: 1-acyl-sn-glycerol-3-phosphate acyltransferase [Acidobacteriia bacterium]|nr:1-acyl-sn-glycerol-3-phosphate acyltransferase [Terriglobia bacterium]
MSDNATPITQWPRTLWRLCVLIGTALQYRAQYLLLRSAGPLSAGRRAQWLHICCRTALQRLHIPIDVQGNFPSRGLLVANHLSYLDILVFSALSPCAFVAKKEVRSWPMFGAMAAMSGTVFVDRSRTTDTQRAKDEMLQALSSGSVLVLFPEGTSSDGSSVLPFRPALFEAAVAAGAPVSSAHISYQADDGSVANDICYWGGMTFLPHLLRLLSRRGVRARVQFASEAKRFDDRKLAANVTREMVLTLAGCEKPQGWYQGMPSSLP